jgi:hypothetical protein
MIATVPLLNDNHSMAINYHSHSLAAIPQTVSLQNILAGRRISKLTASNIALYYPLSDRDKRYDEGNNSHPIQLKKLSIIYWALNEYIKLVHTAGRPKL